VSPAPTDRYCERSRRIDLQTIHAGLWPETEEEIGDVRACAEGLRDFLTRACDSAMPRANSRPRRAVYWWSEEIASLRRSTHEIRRALKRARRRRGTSPATLKLAGAYRRTVKAIAFGTPLRRLRPERSFFSHWTTIHGGARIRSFAKS